MEDKLFVSMMAHSHCDAGSKSPNGNCHKLLIDDNGRVNTYVVPCHEGNSRNALWLRSVTIFIGSMLQRLSSVRKLKVG